MPKFGLGVFQTDNKKTIINSITDIGYRHIDTAACYGNEDIVGQAVIEAGKAGVKREDIFVTTKMWFNDYHCIYFIPNLNWILKYYII